jgi:hypothetical protein
MYRNLKPAIMNKTMLTIGPTEPVDFPEFQLVAVPARVDTGAKTSAIWASHVEEAGDVLRFTLFGETSNFYTGRIIETNRFKRLKIISSNGTKEARYKVILVLLLHGRKIRASFTLANRSAQTYPVLIGRNVLRGKFLVDVKQNQKILEAKGLREKVVRAESRPAKGEA